jgi:hypothetical protein
MGNIAGNCRLVLGIGTTTFMGMLGLAYLVWMSVTP